LAPQFISDSPSSTQHTACEIRGGTSSRKSLPVNKYEFSGTTAVIYNFDSTPIEVVQYEDTDYYEVFKGFTEDRQSHLPDA